MAQLEWAFLCDYAFLDAGRKMCLIGLFQHVVAVKVPSTHPTAALAMRMIGAAGEKVAVRVDISRPTGSTLGRVAGEITLGTVASEGDQPAAEVNFNLVNLLLPDYGSYSIDIHLGDELARTIRFKVIPPPRVPVGAH